MGGFDPRAKGVVQGLWIAGDRHVKAKARPSLTAIEDRGVTGPRAGRLPGAPAVDAVGQDLKQRERSERRRSAEGLLARAERRRSDDDGLVAGEVAARLDDLQRGRRRCPQRVVDATRTFDGDDGIEEVRTERIGELLALSEGGGERARRAAHL